MTKEQAINKLRELEAARVNSLNWLIDAPADHPKCGNCRRNNRETPATVMHTHQNRVTEKRFDAVAKKWVKVSEGWERDADCFWFCDACYETAADEGLFDW